VIIGNSRYDRFVNNRSVRPLATGLLGRPAYALGQLHQTLFVRLERALASEGLSLRTHRVLACVDEKAGRSQQQVSDSLDVDRSEMVRIIDRLEEAGMLVRERDRADRRRYRLKLTPSGRSALERGETVIESVTLEALSRLSDTERDMFHELTLRALGNSEESQSA
jgi:DNA-binding MarR family transcriptional regulator